jgi:3-hydroxyethyl bacteriochlorophyllide a dehydrogenase
LAKAQVLAGEWDLETLAVVIEAPGKLALRQLGVAPMAESDLLVETEWSGISTGTEKLLWTGRMPDFPGMGYPLVPGYESVGRVVAAGPLAADFVGRRVFVPGANCYLEAKGLFGGAARRLVVPAARVIPVDDLGMEAVLLALAATAQHALVGGPLPELIVGHGVLGRLRARLVVEAGGRPTVWEIDAARSQGAQGYRLLHPDADSRRDYASIVDVSGDSNLLDTLIARLARGGEIILAGFYQDRLGFGFSGAFRREARIRVAAEFRPEDLAAVRDKVAGGTLSLAGLVSHVRAAGDAEEAYPRAFEDRDCLKMVLDWRNC